MMRVALAIVAGCPLMAGCSVPITGTTAQMCNSIEPIRPSRKDVLSQGTKEQIVGTNAAIETWCPVKGGVHQKVASR